MRWWVQSTHSRLKLQGSCKPQHVNTPNSNVMGSELVGWGFNGFGQLSSADSGTAQDIRAPAVLQASGAAPDDHIRVMFVGWSDVVCEYCNPHFRHPLGPDYR